VQASATAVADTRSQYKRFHHAVAKAQLIAWLPGGQQFLLDISGPDSCSAQLAADVGHTVLRVIDTATPPPGGTPESGRLRVIAADGSGLDFLSAGCADGVIAEDRTLSRRLAAESLVAEIARVLRPGGEVLACVDSLNLGMAVLAQQNHWPHLVDLPHADVVLVPWPDGTITRCYGAEQLRELFTGSGFDVRWIRPRTMLSPSTVSYLLARDPGSFGRLVQAELRARWDDSVGDQLVISARWPGLAPAVASAPLAVALGLAGNAAGGDGAGLQPGVWYRVPAVHAPSVAAVVNPGQRREHLRPLRHGQLDRGLIAVGLGQVRPGVARLRAAAPGQRVFILQHRDRPAEVVSHFLQALAGNADLHGSPRLLPRRPGHGAKPGRRPPRAQNRGGRSPSPKPDPPDR
jgi:hypothetical protein